MDLNAVSRGWESQREFSYWVPDVDIEGSVPQDLVGTFIRNGPGIHEVYGKKLKHGILLFLMHGLLFFTPYYLFCNVETTLSLFVGHNYLETIF